MLKQFITLALLSSSFGLAAFAQNEGAIQSTLASDFQQPVQIEADREFLDLRADLFRVEGNVVITQGSLIIQADQLEIEGFGNEQGDAERFIATGSPATYEQTIELGMRVTASADKITYNATERLLTLDGNAELMQSGNSVRASRISYDLEKQQITALRGTEDGQRVRTRLQPRDPNDTSNQGNNE